MTPPSQRPPLGSVGPPYCLRACSGCLGWLPYWHLWWCAAPGCATLTDRWQSALVGCAPGGSGLQVSLSGIVVLISAIGTREAACIIVVMRPSGLLLLRWVEVCRQRRPKGCRLSFRLWERLLSIQGGAWRDFCELGPQKSIRWPPVGLIPNGQFQILVPGFRGFNS